jgi:hypothetical protein
MRILGSWLSFEPPWQVLVDFFCDHWFVCIFECHLLVGHWTLVLSSCSSFSPFKWMFVLWLSYARFHHSSICMCICSGCQMPSLFTYLHSYCLHSFLTYGTFLCWPNISFFFLNNWWVGYLLNKNLDHMSSISISNFLIVGQVIKNIWIIIVDLCIRVGYQIIGWHPLVIMLLMARFLKIQIQIMICKNICVLVFKDW